MVFMFGFCRLGETFDRFEIDKLEESRHRDRSFRSINRTQNHNHSDNGRERSSSRHRRNRSRSRSVQLHSRHSAKPKSSIKDRLGAPVRKETPVRQRLSPIPSTSRHQHKNDTHASNDQTDGIANGSHVLQATIDMSDLASILKKCICKFA